MKISDKRIIQFLAKSPLQSFAAMADALRYLDGQWIWEDIEYELFNTALGDNPKGKVSIRVPEIPGIAAYALLNFTWHAKANHVVRRRSRKMESGNYEPDEVVVFYELTPTGKRFLKIIEAIETAMSA
jgi:hypothetical protein